MKILALDISKNSPGWALLDSETGKILDCGIINVSPLSVHEQGEYPRNYMIATRGVASGLMAKVKETNPDVVVVEETNQGRSRYVQKVLEWIHCHFLDMMFEDPKDIPIKYVSSRVWRKKLEIKVSAEDKKKNAKLSKAKSLAKKTGTKLDKKALGIRGKITKKHAAVVWVNTTYGTNFKIGDNDTCEAITLGVAFIRGAELCDGR